ncbi:MAG: flavodoxin family protein [Methanobacterium sp.]
MKVLTIMGSPKRKGNTYRITRKVEEEMKKLGDVEFEYVFLKDLDLKSCLGCGVCMDKGEEICPLNDDRAMMEEKMQNADGVIFTSPNYVFNVTGLMKNFMDRFAYVCHRPRFFKNAMVLTTSGVGGSRFTLMSLSTAPKIWGFNMVCSLGVVTNGDPNSDLSTPKDKVNKRVKDAAKKFYDSLETQNIKPGLFNMASFLFAKENFLKIDPESFDYNYWKNNGWLEKNADYYYDPGTNLVNKAIARLLSKFMVLIEI